MAENENDDIEITEETGPLPEPVAGVEGRSLDTDEEPANEDQSELGPFEKEFVILGDEVDEDEADRLRRNVITQAQQVGLRPTGEPEVGEGTREPDGVSLRVKVTLPVVRAAAHPEAEENWVPKREVLDDETSTEGTEGESVDDFTREELYEQAQEQDVEGRSEMDKQELYDATR